MHTRAHTHLHILVCCNVSYYRLASDLSPVAGLVGLSIIFAANQDGANEKIW